MELVNNFLKSTQNEIIVYVISFILGSVVFFFLAKSKSEGAAALQTLEVVKLVLRNKLGDKADGILDIWIEGLKKIQDGEFSKDDAVDQFVRFIRLGCVQKGIELSEEDVDKIHMLVLSTMETFMGKKPKQIEIAVNKFNAMNHR
jgi:hypothetical protein